MMDNGAYGANQFGSRSLRESFPIDLDYLRQRQRHVEDTDPCIGFVLDVVGHCSFVGINAHEQLARLGELHNEVPVASDHLLYRRVMTEIAQVTKDRHKALRLERGRVNVKSGGV